MSTSSTRTNDGLSFSAVARYCNQRKFAEAEAYLNGFLASANSELRDICSKTGLDQVRSSGWTEVNRAIERLSKKDPITAIGIDLSSHVNSPADLGDWADPGLEVSYYSDSAYPFSQRELSAIQDEFDGSSKLWQGCFQDIDNSVELHGLSTLHRYVRHAVDSYAVSFSDYPSDARLGMAFVILRSHATLVRDAEEQGLLRAMPLIIGEHDFNGPYIDAAYYIGTTAAPRAQIDSAGPDPRYVAQFAGKIEQARERRNKVLGRVGTLAPNDRETFINYCKTIEKIELSRGGLPNGKNSWDLNDDEFESILRGVWRSVKLDLSLFPTAPVNAMPATETSSKSGNAMLRRVIFGRKGT